MDENFYQGLLDEGIALQQILRGFNPNLGPATMAHGIADQIL